MLLYCFTAGRKARRCDTIPPGEFGRVLIGVLVVTIASASPAFAGAEEDALQVVERWAAAFRASDVDAIVALYAPDALFLGTGAEWKIVHPHRSAVPGRQSNGRRRSPSRRL
jgi:hypothetical protein